MNRIIATIAIVFVLGLSQWPVIAQGGGDPFAAPKMEERKPMPNLLPGAGWIALDDEGNPKGWRLKHWRGSEEWKGQVVKEGPKGENCFKVSSGEITNSCWISREIEVKPNTRYEISARIRTENVEPEDGAKGAVVGVSPMREFSRALQGTNDWKRVFGHFETGEDEDKVEVMLLLGGEGRAKGTAWFSDVALREARGPAEEEEEDGTEADDAPPPPPPPTYRRPSFEDPVFSAEALTLDRDQVLALAEDIATLVTNCADHSEIADPLFQAQALGIALRLDPRNRTAVVANGQLYQGQKLKPTGNNHNPYDYWTRIDQWAEKLHSSDATTDDQALGLYLGDLARRVRPDQGFATKFAAAHQGDLAAAWARIVPPPAPPVVPETPPEVADNTNPGEQPDPNETGSESNNSGTDTGNPEAVADNARYKIPDRFPLLTASLFVPVQTGGTESRAALRKATLTFRDYEFHSYWDDSGEKKRRIPHSNQENTYLAFDDNWYRLRDSWNDRVAPMLDRRYEGWPRRGVVDVEIPYYRGSSGSIAVLAVGICFEAMARGLTLDPKVAAVGSWGEEKDFRGHSHLPGVVLGYAKDWPEILIVGPGSRKDLEALAATGLVTPFLCTQIIEVSTFSEAVAIASGQPPPDIKASLEAYRAIMALRTKMDPGVLAKNRHVLDKLREVSSANSKHLSSALLLKAAENQAPLDFDASAKIVLRLFRSLEQLAENDLEWVSPEEGQKAIEVFTERMREFKPRLDRGLDRYLSRLDDCTKALTEAARLRDRDTGTALNRVENAREQVQAFRQSLDLGTAAGR
ncbi:MAG: hypothetical protein ACKO2G_04480 [Verrucomicrobiales bacterium]